jgi:hypothetical protein
MSRPVIVLGTFHEVQGAVQFGRSVSDPLYETLLKDLVSTTGIDFIFEEATGLGPTTAERLVAKALGPNRYLDIDPPGNKREEFFIPTKSNEPQMVGNPVDEARFANWQLLDTHEARERLWLRRIIDSKFDKALMVCGSAHTLSFAFRLRQSNFQVKAIDYLPPIHKMKPFGLDSKD